MKEVISINVSEINFDSKFWETEKSGVAICILNSALPANLKLPCLHTKHEETFVGQTLSVIGYHPHGKGFEITKINAESMKVKSNERCGKDQNVTDKMICVHQPEVDCFIGRGSEFIFIFNITDCLEMDQCF